MIVIYMTNLFKYFTIYSKKIWLITILKNTYILRQKEYFKYQAKGEPDLGKLSALPIAACAGEIVPPNVQRAEAR